MLNSDWLCSLIVVVIRLRYKRRSPAGIINCICDASFNNLYSHLYGIIRHSWQTRVGESALLYAIFSGLMITENQ